MSRLSMGYLWIPIETGWHAIHAGYIPGDHQPWIDWTHQNPNFQITVATGLLRFQRENQRFELNRGDFILLRPNQQHRSWGPVNPESGFYFVQFRTSHTPVWRPVPPLVNRRGPSIHVTHASLPDIGHLTDVEGVLDLFSRLAESHLSQDLYSQVTANGLLAQLVALMAKDCVTDQESDVATGSFTPGQIEIIHKVIEYVEDNLDRPIRPADVCRHLKLSYKYVAKVVKACLGMTLTDYLNRRRIHKARSLLLQGEYSVAQVARAVGFDDPFYFSRVFSAIEGVSPSVFRSSVYIPRG